MSESMNFINAIMNGNEEAMHYAVYLYEQAEKYRWHDLRKNPKDLPEIGTHIVYLFRRKNILPELVPYAPVVSSNAYATVVDIELMREQSNPSYEYIAWKEIEPFEVEE